MGTHAGDEGGTRIGKDPGTDSWAESRRMRKVLARETKEHEDLHAAQRG